MAYTTDEIQALVDSYLLTKVEVPRYDSGLRNTLAIRDAVFDLLTAALLLKPEAFFYIVWLAKNRLVGGLDKEIAKLSQLMDWASSLDDRPVYKVETTTDLVRAEAALLELNGVLNSTANLKNAAVPAVQKFRSAIESFARTELQKNVVDGGDVVETPDELRAKIYTQWQEIRDLRDDNRTRTANLENAVSDFENVRLPTRALQRSVARMQTRLSEIRTTMEGAEAIAQSREAFLELLTMRTLLTKAATFQVPRRTLFEGPVTLVDSPGIPATIDAAAFSAPFMHRATAGFSLIAEDAVEREVFFGWDTRAELRSLAIPAFPVLLTGTTLTVYRDDAVVPLTMTFAADPGSGAALAAAVQVGLGLAADEAVWDAGNSQLVLYGGDGMASRLELRSQTLTEQNFVLALWAGQPLIATARPTEVSDIAAFVAAAPSGAGTVAEVVASGAGDLGRFDATVSGDTAVSEKASTLLTLVDPATGAWTGSGVDLVAAGVAAGDVVVVPGAALVVAAVSATALVTEPTGLAAGPYAASIGRDLRGVPAGAAVELVAEWPLGGRYRALAPLITTPANGVRLDRTTVGGAAEAVLYDRRASFVGRTTAVSSSLDLLDPTVPPPSPGIAAMGYAPLPSPAVAALTRVVGSTDFLVLGLRPGDTVSFGTTQALITAVQPYSFDFAPALQAGPPGPAYQVLLERTGHVAYDTMVTDIGYAGDEVPETALDLAVLRLVKGARYTPATQALFNVQYSYLAAVRAALVAYVVPRELAIDFVVRTMEEQGLDRALDLFLSLDFTTFFAMEPDAVSYATHFVRTAATATRELAPVSKTARDPNIAKEASVLFSKARGYDPWLGS